MTRHTGNWNTYLCSILMAGMALTSVAGCVVDMEEIDSEQHATEGGNDGCPDPVQCNFPSFQLNSKSYFIDELKLDGTESNRSLVRFVQLWSGANQAWDLHIQDGEFVATRPGFADKTGAELVGFRLELDILDDPPQTTSLHIMGYQQTDTWLTGTQPPKVSRYGLAMDDMGVLKNICPHDPAPATTTAYLFKDETYNNDTKTVNPGQTDWLTIACEDSALAKMKLLNYGPESDFDGLGNPATPDQRQATLKMITADYCGGGESFTEPGAELYWTNQAGNADSDWPASLPFEAIWDENGARCLDSTRVSYRSVAQIAAYCQTAYNHPLPSCSTLTPPYAWEWQTKAAPPPSH